MEDKENRWFHFSFEIIGERWTEPKPVKASNFIANVAHRGTMILRVKKLLREEMAFTAVIIIGRETHDSRIIITWPGKVARVDVSGINRAGLRRYYRGNDRARETRPLN